MLAFKLSLLCVFYSWFCNCHCHLSFKLTFYFISQVNWFGSLHLVCRGFQNLPHLINSVCLSDFQIKSLACPPILSLGFSNDQRLRGTSIINIMILYRFNKLTCPKWLVAVVCYWCGRTGPLVKHQIICSCDVTRTGIVIHNLTFNICFKICVCMNDILLKFREQIHPVMSNDDEQETYKMWRVRKTVMQVGFRGLAFKKSR